ncbi:uncharacterized protein LOC128718299 [Anopheles marshallii]|uniref:uncharacterized protein LOC128718299 n=1 Tax=Anopheles marshallii TaxID=1521116 RepID=UPI00237ADB96|nr:uncharacterized protein LOC128718299 [Anopheles marshallii]
MPDVNNNHISTQQPFREISNIRSSAMDVLPSTSNPQTRSIIGTNTDGNTEIGCLDGCMAARALEALTRSHARLATSVQEVLEVIRPRDGLRPRTDFEFAPIDSLEELQSLNAVLQDDSEYKAKLVQWFELQITRVDVNNRLHDLIDLLFTKRFFATMNWSGISKKAGQTKIALGKFKLVLELFVTIGSNKNLVVSKQYVEVFLKKKLYHAKDRINISDSKRTSCHGKR